MTNTTTQQATTTTISDKELTALLTQIATRHISQAQTLQEQGADSLDFLDVSVWSLKDALTEAFLAGQQAAMGGITQIAWPEREFEIIQFTTRGKTVTGIRCANEWEAKQWIADHEGTTGSYAYRPVHR